MEFSFSQVAPAVCLPCRQTDLTARFYHVFSFFPRRFSRISSSKPPHKPLFTDRVEFSFSLDRGMCIPGKQHNRSERTACCSAPSGMLPQVSNQLLWLPHNHSFFEILTFRMRHKTPFTGASTRLLCTLVIASCLNVFIEEPWHVCYN